MVTCAYDLNLQSTGRSIIFTVGGKKNAKPSVLIDRFDKVIFAR
jgi:hypothetical protein